MDGSRLNAPGICGCVTGGGPRAVLHRWRGLSGRILVCRCWPACGLVEQFELLPAAADLCLRIRPALLAARSLADRAAAWGSRRANMFGRYVLRGLDRTLRLLKQPKTVVKVSRPKRMMLTRREGEKTGKGSVMLEEDGSVKFFIHIGVYKGFHRLCLCPASLNLCLVPCCVR